MPDEPMDRPAMHQQPILIDRTPVGTVPMSLDRAFQDTVIDLLEYREEPEVRKTLHVVEEVTLTKSVETGTATVRDEARQTDVEVRRLEQPSRGGAFR